MLSKTLAKAVEKWSAESEIATVLTPSSAAVPIVVDSDPVSDHLSAEMLNILARHARYITNADGAAIALAAGSAVICRASHGYAPECGVELDRQSGICGQCISRGEVTVRQDLEGGVGSVIAIPVIQANESVGLVAVFAERQSAFSTENVDRVSRIAVVISENLSSPKTPDAEAEQPSIECELPAEVPSGTDIPPLVDGETQADDLKTPRPDIAEPQVVLPRPVPTPIEDQPVLFAWMEPQRSATQIWVIIIAVLLLTGAFAGSTFWLRAADPQQQPAAVQQPSAQ